MKKRILILTLLLTLALAAIPAFAATGKVTTKTTTNLFDAYNATSKAWNELKTAQHRLSSNYVAYCLQHKKTVPNSETYKLDDLYDNYSDKVKKGLQIILTNGYPWETGGLTAAQAEYATANAIRFWLSECGDSEFYNQTNLGSFTDAQLRTLAAAGTITKKIRVRDTSYIPALQFSVELLIKARAQQTITHDVALSASNVSAARSGNVFSGSTSITVTNLRGGYTLDSSALPAGSTVTGYTGTASETLTMSEYWNTNCPCCDKHCPLDHPGCDNGERYAQGLQGGDMQKSDERTHDHGRHHRNEFGNHPFTHHDHRQHHGEKGNRRGHHGKG